MNNNVYKNEKLGNAIYQKSLKIHPLEVAKNMWKRIPHAPYLAAHDPQERLQINKPKHYTIYKTEQEKKGKYKKKKTSEEDDQLTQNCPNLPPKAPNTFRTPHSHPPETRNIRRMLISHQIHSCYSNAEITFLAGQFSSTTCSLCSSSRPS